MSMGDSNSVLCSTGIITHFPDYPSHRPIVDNRAKIDADHFELMIYPNWYSNMAEVVADLTSENISFPAVHADKRIGSLICEGESGNHRRALDIFAMNCEVAKQLGADFAVLHLWGLPCSDQDFGRNLDALGKCMRIAETFHIGVTVEPLYCSLRDPLTNFREVSKRYPECGITMDLRILGYHDQIAELYKHDWMWDRPIRYFHVNDYAGPAFNIDCGCHPGDGDIDFDAMFGFLASIGFLGTFTMEAASLDAKGGIRFEKLNRSLGFVKQKVSRLNRSNCRFQ